MTLNRRAAYGLYPQDVALPAIVRTLNDAGFGNEDICMMLSPTHPIATVVRDASFDSERGANTKTASLIGWLSGFGAVVMPTIGFFIRSQAFYHALVVATPTPSPRGGSTSLVTLGFPDNEAERFEDQLRRDGALIYVSCSEAVEPRLAIEVLQRTGARESATLERELVAEAVA